MVKVYDMHRLSLELDRQQADRLQQITGELGDTQAGVLRNGLRLLSRAVTAAKSGGQIAIVSSDGRVSFISGPWDDVQEARA